MKKSGKILLSTLSENAKGLYTGMILLDIQKAFETVNHNILCSKLKLMGVVSTYLSNRSQIVTVSSANSDLVNVTCGVPQGSILGPLLFLRKCKLHGYLY